MARLLSLVAVLVSCATSAPAQTATLTMLPEEFEVYDLSGDGRVVVGWVTNVTPRYAATWTREAGVQPIPKPPSWGATLARAVNHDGTVIAGEAATLEGVRAFVYKPETGMVALGVLQGASSSISLGVSSSGEWTCGNSGAFPYRYHVPTGVMERLADPGYPNDSFNASAISNSGIVVGAAFSSKGGTADPYEWPTPSQACLLDPPGGNRSGACVAITPDGRSVIATTDNPHVGPILDPFPMIWHGADRVVRELIEPGIPSVVGIFVVDANDTGHIIAISIRRFQQNSVAGLWTPQTGVLRLRDVLTSVFGLSLPEGEASSADAISSEGEAIVLAWRFRLPGPIFGVLDWNVPCEADCTLDWRLDIFDFLCFMNKYVANDPYACELDTLGSSACDVFDFFAFQRVFIAGCY